MSRQLILKSPDGSSSLLTQVDADNEAQLQEHLKDNPELIPIEDMGTTGPALVVGRESNLESGRVDLVLLSAAGDLLLVEFKTGPQNPDFRAALAQLVDYGSDLWGMTVEDFNRRVAEPFFASSHNSGQSKNLEDAAAARWSGQSEDAIDWRERLAAQLRDGSFHYVVVAQRFTPSILRTLRYLNATSRKLRFSAVEMIRFSGSDHTAFEARVVAAAQPNDQRTATAKAALAGVEGFISAIADDEYRHALTDIFAGIAEIDGLFVFWGSTGCSLRVQLPGRSPLSVGWIFPPGPPRWMGLTDVTLGWYQDPAASAFTATQQAALAQYVSQIEALPGSEKLSTAKIHGRLLKPSVTIANQQNIVEAIQDVTTGLIAG